MPAPSLKDISDDLAYRKNFWRPRDMRMDRWFLLYSLIDAFQASKPVSRKRFISNEPMTTVDRAESIIARNPLQYQIQMEQAKTEEEGVTIEGIEHLLVGVDNQIDKDLIKQGHKRARRIAAQHALLRGWIAWSLSLNHNPGKYKKAINYTPYDPRFVYPRFDDQGLHSVMCEDYIFAGTILDQYPRAANALGIKSSSNKMEVFLWYEYIDREYRGIAASQSLDALLRKDGRPVEWLEVPRAHGRSSLPFGMIPVHGVEMRFLPSMPSSYNLNPDSPREVHALAAPKDYFRAPNAWSANMGRSILSAVEDTMPQFNELIATIWQIASNNAFGTWFIKTRGAKHIPFKPGENVVNFGDLMENVQRFGSDTAPPDLGVISNLLGSQIQRGTLSYALFGDTEFAGSGFLFSQIEEAALNAIDDWRDGVKLWGELKADMFMEEYREGGYKALEVQGRDSKNRMFIETIDPKDIKKTYHIEVELRPALPSDMMQRVQMARLLLDPRRPIASLQTVFDKVLMWPDAKGELDRIFEDIAYTDPLIVMERIARILEQRGADEFAQVLREKAQQQQWMQNAQFEMAQMQMAAMTGQVPPGQSPPENMGNTEGAPPTPAGQASPGVGGAGAGGYTNGY